MPLKDPAMLWIETLQGLLYAEIEIIFSFGLLVGEVVPVQAFLWEE